jgi:hypothetical protein
VVAERFKESQGLKRSSGLGTLEIRLPLLATADVLLVSFERSLFRGRLGCFAATGCQRNEDQAKNCRR